MSSLVLMIRLCCILHLAICLSALLSYTLQLRFLLHLMLIVLALMSLNCSLLKCYELKLEQLDLVSKILFGIDFFAS